MRGANVRFYEVDTVSDIPSTMQVGALYFCRSDRLFLINHGKGRVITYGAGNVQFIEGVLQIASGGTGAGTKEGARLALGITDDVVENQQEHVALTQTVAETFSQLSESFQQLNTSTAGLLQAFEMALTQEAETRAAADTSLRQAIDSAVGKLRYMPPNNFGKSLVETDADDQALLTTYALDHLGIGTVPNAADIINLFDSHEWVYNDDTDMWIDLGVNNVAPADNENMGIVQGGTAEGSVNVVEGVMTFPKATQEAYGGVRAIPQSGEYGGKWALARDDSGKAFVEGRTDDEADALDAASQPSATNPFATEADLQNVIPLWNGGVDGTTAPTPTEIQAILSQYASAVASLQLTVITQGNTLITVQSQIDDLKARVDALEGV